MSASSFDLHGIQASAPVRIVQMTADVLGLPFNFKICDLNVGDNMKPEYLAINPMHNIPTMVDGDFCLNESRAIATYLVNKSGQDKLLPKDVKTRAIVEQRMYFDMGTFYKAYADCVYPVMFGSPVLAGDKEKDRLSEVMGWVEDFVKDGKFIAGTDRLTLGDISCLSTFSSLEASGLFDGKKYPNTLAWFEKCKGEIPNYEKMNGEGASEFGQYYKSKL